MRLNGDRAAAILKALSSLALETFVPWFQPALQKDFE